MVKHNQPVTEPYNLAKGWVRFDYAAAFGCPVKIINDAAMQALGSYNGGTCCSSAWEPVWARHWWSTVSWCRWNSRTFRIARQRTRTMSASTRSSASARKNGASESRTSSQRLVAAFRPDDVVLGGGNSRQLKELPPGCRLGDNDNAFLGGFRLWAWVEAAPAIARRFRARSRKRSR